MPPSKHHATLPPSSWPMLDKCPCYRSSDETSEAADAGTKQHAALEALLRGTEPDWTGIEDAKDDVEWARQWVLDNTDDDRLVEEPLSLMSDDFDEITYGTGDVAGRLRSDPRIGVVLDYKSGQTRDYKPQGMPYVLAWMQRKGFDIVDFQVVYGRLRYVEHYMITRAEAEAFVADFLARFNDPNKAPTPCDYCGWCADHLSCPAVVKDVVAVAKNYGGLDLDIWHPSEVSDPRTMAKMLDAAKWITKWAKSVEHHAKQLAVDDGVPIPGYEIKTRKGASEVANIPAAFAASGLPQEAFLGCCKVTMGQLDKAFQESTGLKKAEAKRELRKKLDPYMINKGESKYLKRIGSNDDDGTDE